MNFVGVHVVQPYRNTYIAIAWKKVDLIDNLPFAYADISFSWRDIANEVLKWFINFSGLPPKVEPTPFFLFLM